MKRSQVSEALKSIENAFIKKRLEDSQHEEQKHVTNFFPVTKQVLRYSGVRLRSYTIT